MREAEVRGQLQAFINGAPAGDPLHGVSIYFEQGRCVCSKGSGESLQQGRYELGGHMKGLQVGDEIVGLTSVVVQTAVAKAFTRAAAEQRRREEQMRRRTQVRTDKPAAASSASGSGAPPPPPPPPAPKPARGWEQQRQHQGAGAQGAGGSGQGGGSGGSTSQASPPRDPRPKRVGDSPSALTGGSARTQPRRTASCSQIAVTLPMDLDNIQIPGVGVGAWAGTGSGGNGGQSGN